jgi:multidrug resistance efflux pump
MMQVQTRIPQTQGSETASPNGTAPKGTSPKGASRAMRTLWISLGAVLVAALVVGGYVGYQYLDGVTNYVSTDNAQVVDPAVPVGSMNAGRLTRLDVVIGASVHAGDVLAQIELPTLVRSLQNGTPDLEFTGGSDEFVDVRAPIDGIVIAIPGAVGQTVSPGEPLVTLVDPGRMWITANVDEASISKVRIGQDAQVYVPAEDRTFSGKVQSITPATAGSFLPAPYTNATADFTQVDALVPVNIQLDPPHQVLYPGASAVVTIKIGSSFP